MSFAAARSDPVVDTVDRKCTVFALVVLILLAWLKVHFFSKVTSGKFRNFEKKLRHQVVAFKTAALFSSPSLSRACQENYISLRTQI